MADLWVQLHGGLEVGGGLAGLSETLVGHAPVQEDAGFFRRFESAAFLERGGVVGDGAGIVAEREIGEGAVLKDVRRFFGFAAHVRVQGCGVVGNRAIRLLQAEVGQGPDTKRKGDIVGPPAAFDDIGARRNHVHQTLVARLRERAAVHDRLVGITPGVAAGGDCAPLEAGHPGAHALAI